MSDNLIHFSDQRRLPNEDELDDRIIELLIKANETLKKTNKLLEKTRDRLKTININYPSPEPRPQRAAISACNPQQPEQ